MDESMQTYLDHQRTKLFHDCKYRAKNETWLNRAYAMMLVDQGFLSKEEYRTIDKGLVQVLNTVTEEDMKNASNAAGTTSISPSTVCLSGRPSSS